MESNPICQPSSAKKNEMLLFGLCSTSDDQLGLSMDLNPIHHLSPAKKMKCSYFDYVHFRWLAGLVNGLEPHPPPLSSQKSEMLIFLLQSNSDLGQTGQWTQTPSTTHLHPIKWNACFCITLNVWWLAGLSDGLKPHLPPLFSQKMKSSFLDYVQLLMISQAVRWTQTQSATPLQPKKWNAHFWILFNFWWSAWLVNGLEPHLPPLSSQKKWNTHFCITINFWFRPDWSMDSNPIHHPSPTNKMKCLFLDYAQLLMIGWTGWWTQTPSATPLQSQNEMLIFGLCSTSNDQPGWSMDSNPICHPSPAKKMKCLFLDYIHFGWLARLVNGLKPHPPPLSSQ